MAAWCLENKCSRHVFCINFKFNILNRKLKHYIEAFEDPKINLQIGYVHFPINAIKVN